MSVSTSFLSDNFICVVLIAVVIKCNDFLFIASLLHLKNLLVKVEMELYCSKKIIVHD